MKQLPFANYAITIDTCTIHSLHESTGCAYTHAYHIAPGHVRRPLLSVSLLSAHTMWQPKCVLAYTIEEWVSHSGH